MSESGYLSELTTEELKLFLANGPTVALVPVGSVEPHGPHLPLGTDSILSETAADRATIALEEAGIHALVAPTVSYGVTDFAGGFSGALTIPAPVLTAYLKAIVESLQKQGFSQVCLVNNHLEPAHDEAVRAAIAGNMHASCACPLERRFARTLSDEFKKGECHAGRYETSLVLAANQEVIGYENLQPMPVSLSDGIRAGKKTFLEMGMTSAYSGAPNQASAEEGDALYEKLVEMIVTVVREGLARGAGAG
ncbi:MAG: creatininase family protein [Polyangiaceae bacterium]